eukprot:jgi/Chlat1/3916/Chrsp26S04024
MWPALWTDASRASVPWLLLAVGAAVVGASYYVYWFLIGRVRWYFNYMERQGVPVANDRPIVGIFPELREIQKSGEPFKLALNFRKQYGRVYMVALGPVPLLNVQDPELLWQMLVKNANHYTKAEFVAQGLRPLLGNGLVLAEHENWARQRRLVNPSFHAERVKEMVPIMVACTAEAVDKWAREVREKGLVEVDMRHDMSALTLHVMGTASFSAGEAASKNSQFVYERLTALQEFTDDLVNKGLIFIPFHQWLPLTRRAMSARAHVRSFVQEIITAKRKALAAEHDRSSKGSSPAADTHHQDLLGSLLLAKEENNNAGGNLQLTDEELLDQVQTFLFAGHETTAQLMCFTLRLLSDHPEWCEKAREEVREVCGSGFPEASQLDKLKVCTMIFYETLRLYPPVPFTSRVCTTEHRLGEYNIPKGVAITINVCSVHRDAELWPEPDEFKPERFEGGLAKACKHPFAFLPFLGGPRVCIGQKFALYEAKVILAMLLQRFSFRQSPGQDLGMDSQVTLRPRSMLLQLTELKAAA